MIVEHEELGERPKLWTRARLFAPQAAERMAKVLSTQTYAAKGFVRLDWTDVSDRLPDDAKYPVLYLQVVGDVKGRQLREELRFDVDDIFAAESMTPTLLVDILHDLQEAFEKEALKGPDA